MKIRWLLFLGAMLSHPLSAAEDLLSIHQTALERDPAFRAAAAARRAVDETKIQARAGLLPRLDLNADINRSRQDVTSASIPSAVGESTDTNKSYSLSLNQPLFRYQNYVVNRQADARIVQAEAQFQDARQALALRVAQAYFDVLAARDNLAFARAEKEAIARQLEQTRQRFEVGLIAITDVHESQAAYDTTVAAEITAENSLNIAMEILREITGQPVSEIKALSAEIPLLTPDPADARQWVERALEQNLQLAAREQSVDIARQEIGSARAGHYPNVDLYARYSHSDSGGGLSIESDTTTFGVQMSMNLFQGNAINAGVREARHLLTQTEEGYEQQRRAVERGTRSAYLDTIASISQVKALQQALVSTQSALEASEAGLEVGTRTTVDVLAARRELFRAQSNLAQARYGYLINTLRLKEAAGMLGEQDLAQINQWLK